MKIFNLLGIVLIIVLLSSCEGIKLTVESGSGSGNYGPNRKVQIKAYIPNPGYEFDRWEGDIQYLEDIASNETYVLLPELSDKEALEIKVKAIYEVDPSAKEYNLIVEEGSGSGSYLTYSVVTIKANNTPSGYQFDKWVGDVEYVYNEGFSTLHNIRANPREIDITYRVKEITERVLAKVSAGARKNLMYPVSKHSSMTSFEGYVDDLKI